MKLHYIAYHRETGEAKQLTVDTCSAYREISDGRVTETLWRTRKTSAKDDVEFFLRCHSSDKRIFIWDVRKVAKGTIPWTPEMYFAIRQD